MKKKIIAIIVAVALLTVGFTAIPIMADAAAGRYIPEAYFAFVITADQELFVWVNHQCSGNVIPGRYFA